MLLESARRRARILSIRWKRRNRSPGEQGILRGMLWTVGLMLLALLLPLILVGKERAVEGSRANSQAAPSTQIAKAGGEVDPKLLQTPEAAEPYIHVYLHAEGKIERVSLEQYVRGVLAAEMPIEFELEALKAQAIASRTYIVRRLEQGLAGQAEQGADVNDTISYQAYLSQKELAKRDEVSIQKLNRAVNETSGQILTYQDKPIEALFFSTSNGYTENAEDYWNHAIPYLKSVASPWDQALSPRYKTVITISPKEFAAKLNIPMDAVPAFSKIGSNPSGGTEPSLSDVKIIEKTKGKRIGELNIGGYTFSGREFREKLGLRSSDVKWKSKDGMIELTTYGYGHGVGMSQYGAQGMALKGAAAETILKHYYQGVKLSAYKMTK